MLISYKTEINPTDEQINKILQCVGICRWLYNEYIAYNIRLYKLYVRGYLDERQKHFISGMDFDKYVNNTLKKKEGFEWISLCGSKARKKAIMTAEKAFKRFFQKKSGFPQFKRKNRQNTKIYFPKNNPTDWTIERHRVKIPTFGFVRIKEFGYLPVDGKVVNGTISQRVNRFYVSVTVDVPERKFIRPREKPLGIDLGVKELAILSDGTMYRNINKDRVVKRLKKQLSRAQRRLARQLEDKKKRGGTALAANIKKSILKIQKFHAKLDFIRTNYENQVIHQIVMREPSHITIEDLNVSGMMKNRHLARAIGECRFRTFRTKLTQKCCERGIEVRVVSTFYPSSKKCHECGNVKKGLKLSDRIYVCDVCGHTMDRDVHAAMNLRDALEYIVS
jgi:hypothetical protein